MEKKMICKCEKQNKELSGIDNLAIDYLGEKEIIDINGSPGFKHHGLGHGSEEFLLSDFVRVNKAGDFKSFDAEHGTSAWDGYLIKLVDAGGGYFEKVKLYHYYQKG